MDEAKSSKKPFVKPALTEEASLEDVTLMSGGLGNLGGDKKLGRGGHGGHGKKLGTNKPHHGRGRRT